MASVADQLFYTDAPGQSDDYVDFDQFLDLPMGYGDDYSASVNSISPDMSLPYDADMFGNELPELEQPAFPDMVSYDLSQEAFLANQSPSVGLMPDPGPVLDEAVFHDYQPYGNTFTFRQMVEAQAAADPRIASIKEKRREASIALHLQRQCDAIALDLDMSSDSNTSFSSPSWSDYMRESISPQPASASPDSTPAPASAQGNGGVELVLDLNMNATTNLPKKQKPRSQAQKENYIKARKYGACEKHKKQHKRCNCLKKAAARAGVSEVPMDVAFKERPRQPMLPMPVLPDTRSTSVPGHERLISVISPTAKVIKKLTSTNSPRYDSSLYTSALQQSIKTPTNTSSVRGHDPQHNQSAVLPPVRDGKPTASAPGHDPSYQTRSTPQSVKATRKAIDRPEWRLSSFGFSPTTNSVLSTEKKNPSLSSPTNRLGSCISCTKVELRRPRMSLLTRHVKSSPSTTATLNQTLSTRGVRDSGHLEVSGFNHRSSSLESRQPLAIVSTRSDPTPKTERYVSGGNGLTSLVDPNSPNGSIVRSVAAQIGGLFAKTVLATAGAWQSSLSFVSWSEAMIYRCLSFSRKQLSSAQKGLQLYQMRTFWSA